MNNTKCVNHVDIPESWGLEFWAKNPNGTAKQYKEEIERRLNMNNTKQGKGNNMTSYAPIKNTWSYGQEYASKGYRVRHTDGGETIAHVREETAARLIATAPQLLEACKYAIKAIGSQNMMDLFLADGKLKEALRKAGELND